MDVIKTKAEWLSVVEALRSGQVRFSTGRQQRGAGELANFIEDVITYSFGDDEIAIELDPDSALSVVQASGWARIDVASLFRGFM